LFAMRPPAVAPAPAQSGQDLDESSNSTTAEVTAEDFQDEATVENTVQTTGEVKADPNAEIRKLVLEKLKAANTSEEFHELWVATQNISDLNNVVEKTWDEFFLDKAKQTNDPKELRGLILDAPLCGETHRYASRKISELKMKKLMEENGEPSSTTTEVTAAPPEKEATNETSVQDTEEAALPGDEIILDKERESFNTAETILLGLARINESNIYILTASSILDSRRFDIIIKAQESKKMKDLVERYNEIFNQYLDSEEFSTLGELRKAVKHRAKMREDMVVVVNEILKILNK
ncbi:MAG TPA: hypothetical protein P5056_03005, partial [Candidatus Paceibacterota bacterium]|nr:hypothetical protein [Candidatus Paceibacterota bacterium]